jgi:hypothetical protein
LGDPYFASLLCLFCVLTKAAEMISEISGTPVNLVAKHWIQRISFATYKSHCETFSDKIIIILQTISVIHNWECSAGVRQLSHCTEEVLIFVTEGLWCVICRIRQCCESTHSHGIPFDASGRRTGRQDSGEVFRLNSKFFVLTPP